MPRQTILTRPTAAGTEWPSAAVDAPDAYYAQVRVRLIGKRVTIYDTQWNPMGRYDLDETPETPEPGTVVGTVDLVPLAIRTDHYCDCNVSRKYPKGQR